MTIRQYAKECGFAIVGKLHRKETPNNAPWKPTDKHYTDDAGNEYTLCVDGSIVIVTVDGAVI